MNPDSALLVKAIVEVARALGKKTVAEYVGDEETLRLLQQFGVDYGQGFYLGKPEKLSESLSRDWSSGVAVSSEIHVGDSTTAGPAR